MIRIQAFLNIYLLIITAVYLLNIQYFQLYIFNQDVMMVSASFLLLGVLALSQLVLKNNFYLSIVMIPLIYFIRPIGQEFGSFSLIAFLFIVFAIFTQDEKRQYFILRLLLMSLYGSLLLGRFNDLHWAQGSAALVVANTFHFQGILDLTSLQPLGFIGKVLTYLSLTLEFIIAASIMTKFRAMAFVAGIILHFGLLLCTNIFNWHLLMLIFYFLLFEYHFNQKNNSKH